MSSATADDVNAVSGQLNAERTAQDVAGRIVVQPCHVTALMMSAITSVVTLVPLMEGNRRPSPPGLEEQSAIRAVCSEVPLHGRPKSSALRAKA